MVKLKEVRIGNKVIKGGSEHTIGLMDLIDLETRKKSKKSPDLETTLFLEPIPITQDWLVRAGFILQIEKDGSLNAHLGFNPITQDNLFKITNTGQGFFFNNAFFKFHCVHQLQNLYHALTGQELKFKKI